MHDPVRHAIPSHMPRFVASVTATHSVLTKCHEPFPLSSICAEDVQRLKPENAVKISKIHL